MKFVFIINPVAGTGEKQGMLAKQIKAYSGRHETEVYLTRYAGDAKRFVSQYGQDRQVCFVACGGDGTLNEVVSGAYRTANKIACIPCGSGNDFIKNISPYDYFDLPSLFDGKEERIDALLCNERVCINTCCIGFDSKIAMNKDKFKRLPFVSGKMAYILSLIYCFAGSLEYDLTITNRNGSIMQEGGALLCLFANGRIYGGGFAGAPLAMPNDGLIDLCFCRSVPKWKIISLIADYKRGNHPGNPKYEGILTYCKGEGFTVSSAQPFVVCLDGECAEYSTVDVRIEAGALGLWLPTQATLLCPQQAEKQGVLV